MPTITLNIHRIMGVRARLSTVKDSTWVDLNFYDKDGKPQEVTIFFDDNEFAERFVGVINTLNYDPENEVALDKIAIS